jgi:hypothetical protein
MAEFIAVIDNIINIILKYLNMLDRLYYYPCHVKQKMPTGGYFLLDAAKAFAAQDNYSYLTTTLKSA